MNTFKIIRKSTSNKGGKAKTYVYCLEDKIVFVQLFLLKTKDKNMKVLCRKFGVYLQVTSMAFKYESFFDLSNQMTKELLKQEKIKYSK